MKWYFKHYGAFSGRARRKEYWLFQLYYVLIFLGVGLLVEALCDAAGMTGENHQGLINFYIVLYFIANLLPSLAVSVRRLHDTNRSGWYLLLGLIPFVGTIILLVFFCQDGQRGSNQFGPDPKQLAAAIVTV